jgi:hypothetical protein
MALSAEAIISIVGVLTNLPPAILILWNLWKWMWAKEPKTSGKFTSLALRHLMNQTDMVVVEEGHESASNYGDIRRNARRRSTVATLILEPR